MCHSQFTRPVGLILAMIGTDQSEYCTVLLFQCGTCGTCLALVLARNNGGIVTRYLILPVTLRLKEKLVFVSNDYHHGKHRLVLLCLMSREEAQNNANGEHPRL